MLLCVYENMEESKKIVWAGESSWLTFGVLFVVSETELYKDFCVYLGQIATPKNVSSFCTSVEKLFVTDKT